MKFSGKMVAIFQGNSYIKREPLIVEWNGDRLKKFRKEDA